MARCGGYRYLALRILGTVAAAAAADDETSRGSADSVHASKAAQRQQRSSRGGCLTMGCGASVPAAGDPPVKSAAAVAATAAPAGPAAAAPEPEPEPAAPAAADTASEDTAVSAGDKKLAFDQLLNDLSENVTHAAPIAVCDELHRFSAPVELICATTLGLWVCRVVQMGLNSLIFTVTQGIPRVVGAEICTVYLCDYSKSELWSVATGSGSEFRIPISMGLAGHVRLSRLHTR